MLDITQPDIFDNLFVFCESTGVYINNSGELLTIVNYLHGRCHLFAIALKNHFGDKVQIHSIIEYIPVDGDSPPVAHLVHSYISVDNGVMLDARGVITEADLMEFPIFGLETETIIMSTEGVLASAAQWGEPNEHEISYLEIFIAQNREIYTLELPDDDLSDEQQKNIKS
ncbi:hypothetical protein DDO73_20000, partial [Vibrio cholerae]|nr:hypothetical protein [Vibrio cholerae]